VKKRNPEIFYSLALGVDEDGFERVAAAEVRTVVPRSFVFAATRGRKCGQGMITRGGRVIPIQRGKKERTEDDLVSFLPHLRDDRLARVNNTSEPDLDVLILPKRLQNVLARDTHSAQSMEDGPREPEPVKSVPCTHVCYTNGSRAWGGDVNKDLLVESTDGGKLGQYLSEIKIQQGPD